MIGLSKNRSQCYNKDKLIGDNIKRKAISKRAHDRK